MIAHHVDLSGLVDRIGATYDTDRDSGEFNPWGNSFPAEELPFGGTTAVGGVPYALVDKPPRGPDHLEALGQVIDCAATGPAHGLALLAAGEQGPQELRVHVHLDGGRRLSLPVTVPGWSVRPDAPMTPDQLRAGHLHYPGDYGLARLLPALWSRVLRLPGVPVTAIELTANPLVHVFAVTLEIGAAR
ncbi:MAG: hypothetical protein HOV94_26625 [Saccharothrix sp.]|nr:hypothetical protein [Saccharothrix sp.]